MYDIKYLKRIFEMVSIVTISQMKSRYRKTFVGFLWVVLNPILTFVVQGLIFKNILKIQLDNYYLFLLAGIVPWVFITSSVTMTVSCFITNRPTLLAFKIEPWILLLAQILDNFINFFISYMILIFFVDLSSFGHFLVLPLFLLSTLILTLFVFYISFILSITNVFLRDTQFIVSFAISLAYFVTPIFYPISMVPEKFQILMKFNPFYIFIRPFQSLIWEYNLESYWNDLFTTVWVLALIAVTGTIIWRKKKNELYFNL